MGVETGDVGAMLLRLGEFGFIKPKNSLRYKTDMCTQFYINAKIVRHLHRKIVTGEFKTQNGRNFVGNITINFNILPHSTRMRRPLTGVME